MGSEIVRGQRTCQLVIAERLEVACRRKVALSPITLGERAIGDLADERLHEAVLTTFRRARIELNIDELAPAEVAQSRLEAARVLSGNGGKCGQREALSQNGGILQECPVCRIKGVEARGNEGSQSFRYG